MEKERGSERGIEKKKLREREREREREGGTKRERERERDRDRDRDRDRENGTDETDEAEKICRALCTLSGESLPPAAALHQEVP